jgi:predicted TIM-barrel fold metal-dependent hydrolase
MTKGSQGALEVVDGQIHLGPGGVETTLAAMDALGVRAALIDEYWGASAASDRSHLQPGHRLEGGVWRCICPTAELAAAQYPDRFAYLLRVDRRDPGLEGLLRTVSGAPGGRAIRLMPVWNDADADAFAGGACVEVFAVAQDLALPVFLFIPGQVELLHAYASRFPRLTFIVDHCGMPSTRGFSQVTPRTDAQRQGGPRYIEEVLSLAEHANVALKWSHANERFGDRDYPYRGLRPFLRRSIEAFGAHRLVWGSDHTVIPDATWAQLLFSVRDDPELSQAEKAALLGGSLRTLLRWPAAPREDAV